MHSRPSGELSNDMICIGYIFVFQVFLFFFLTVLMSGSDSSPAEDRPAKQADYAKLSHSSAIPVFAKTTVGAAVPLSKTY